MFRLSCIKITFCTFIYRVIDQRSREDCLRLEDPEILDPTVHCFARCFSCRNLVRIGENEEGDLDFSERQCPNCGVFLDEEGVSNSFVVELLHTTAITSANKVSSFDIAIFPYLGVGVLLAAVGYPYTVRVVNLIPYLFILTIYLRWFYRYWYKCRFDDPEYLESVSAVRKSFYIWIAATILNWTLLLFRPESIFNG